MILHQDSQLYSLNRYLSYYICYKEEYMIHSYCYLLNYNNQLDKFLYSLIEIKNIRFRRIYIHMNLRNLNKEIDILHR